MARIWIVHRNPTRRAALARLAAAGVDSVQGAPGDPVFDAAPAPDAVVLGTGGDLEAELQFVHRAASRAPNAAWILLTERNALDDVRRLFDGIEADILAYPPEARTLRARIRGGVRQRGRRGEGDPGEPAPLSARRARELLTGRFSRWFADLDLPALLRALDPRLGDVPLLVHGEPGTGRELLVRYVHAFRGGSTGPLIQVVCTPDSSGAALREAVAQAGRVSRPGRPCSVWLVDLDRLPSPTQRELQSWIEFEPPPSLARAARVRWLGTTDDAVDGGALLAPGLAHVLGGLSIRIPPLRERPSLVARFANELVHEWCTTRNERPRRMGEDAVAALEEYPWPGNLRELESVVVQTLAAGAADPVRADDLRYEEMAFAPLDLAEAAVELPEEDAGGGGPQGEEELPEPVFLDEEEISPVTERAAVAGQAGPEPGTEPAAEPKPGDSEILRRLVGALAHEVRNPLTSIRSFAELLPERYTDTGFRTRFAELVTRDVLRIEDVVERLAGLAALAPPRLESVDVAALLENILEQRRDIIRKRRLLVLKELEATRPNARADATQLRFACEALINSALELVPERGDLYLASRYNDEGLHGDPSIRVLLRFHGPEGSGSGAPLGVSQSENALEFAIADAIIRAQGGSLTIHTTEGDETVILLDLQATP